MAKMRWFGGFCLIGVLVVTVGYRTVRSEDALAESTSIHSSDSTTEGEVLRPLGRPTAIRPVRLKTPLPDFLKDGSLGRGYREGVGDLWVRAGSERTFEAEARTLEDFSQIDIPIKFPKTIGRVIGQGANLNVSGSEQITFGGRTRYMVDEPLTEFGRRSKFPTLDMKQHLKIDLKGTVGEKIHVMVHHDSEIETPLENRIKLRYEGDDDEIVQSIEMGNTNLAIPGSQFVSYSGQQKGLFGAKMLAKLGPLAVTAIASKQEGRTAGARFEGAATRDSIRMEAKDFIKNKYFYLVDPYQRNPDFLFTDVKVYLDDDDGTNNFGEAVDTAYAFLDPSSPPPESEWDTGPYRKRVFSELRVNEDYAVDQYSGEISLLRSLQPQYTLAVSFNHGGVQVGGRDGQGRLVLKLIRPSKSDLDSYEDLRTGTVDLMRKNIYALGAAYISEERVEVRIYKREDDTDVQEAYEFSKILGIDLKDENGIPADSANNWNTDGYADGGRIYRELGLLLFPDVRPFDPKFDLSGERPEVLNEENRDPIMYDNHPGMDDWTSAYQSKFYMIVRYSTPQTTFKLPHINILENSEVVTLNGRRLTANVDYEIYYDIGQIRFKTDEAASPDAQIAVDYQYVPFLSLAQQSLVGFQGIYRFSESSHVGTAWLYQSKKSPEERPRLGQEPSRIVMGDVNAQFQFSPDFMTSMVDALPVVEADQPSRLTVTGELGMSLPNPNTKGNVYVDDMEGLQDLRSFSVMRDAWVPSSPPVKDLSSGEYLRWEDTRNTSWYTVTGETQNRNRTVVGDLYPDSEDDEKDTIIPVLETWFRGPKYGELDFDPANTWGGLMSMVSKTGSDYSELKFLEMWVRYYPATPGQDNPKVHVDLGAISENFYRPWEPNVLNTEDRDLDGTLSQDEDTGLDGCSNEDALGGICVDDDDDWYFSDDYSHINGTEGNRGVRPTPDTEDLNGNGNLDVTDVHFRMEFEISEVSPYNIDEGVSKDGWGKWLLFRVPLRDAIPVGGSPSWRSVRYIRYFFTGIAQDDRFQVAYLQVSGTNWPEEGIRVKETMERPETIPTEEIFEVSAKNTKENKGDYTPPYTPEKDPEGNEKREQSLVFSFENLGDGHSGSVYKLLPGKGNDYTLYRTMAFYVHGRASQADHLNDLYLFVRIGSDSVNFYEYATRVNEGWKTVEVPLEQITNIKSVAVPDSGDTLVGGIIAGKRTIYTRTNIDYRYRQTDDGWIAAYGNPSITRIMRLGAGVANKRGSATSGEPIEVWFDDLRLTDVRKEAGFAKRISVSAAFSDLVTLNLDFRQTDTEFQTLGSPRRGSDDTDYTITTRTSIDRFMPDLGITLPFSMRYHKSHSLPTLQSRSDIALMPDQREKQQKSSVDDSYQLNFSKRRKSKNPLLRLSFDGLSASISYGRKRGASPELADTSSTYTGGIGYNFSPWWTHTQRIYRGYMISYLPENVSANISGSIKHTKKINLRQKTRPEKRYIRDVKGVFSVGFKPFSGPSVETDYSLKMTRDLDIYKKVSLVSSLGWGRELRRTQSASLLVRRTFGQWMKPTLSYKANYDENSDPSLRAGTDAEGVRRVTLKSGATVDLVLTMGSVFDPGQDSGDTTGTPLYVSVLSKIPDIMASYVLNRDSKYNKISKRPGLIYQLGIDPVLSDDLILVGTAGAARPNDEYIRGNGFNLSTEFRPIQSVSVGSKYKFNKSVRTYAGAKTFNQTVIWPDITANVSSMSYLSFLENIVKSSSVAVGFKGTSTSGGEGTSDENRREHKAEWLPLVGWDATWSNGLRTTFNVRHSRGQKEDLKGSGSVKKSKQTTVNLSLRHSFSAPQGMYIPLAGRTLKFTSNLTLSLDVNYETRLAWTPTGNNRIDTSTRKFSIQPKASYSFSKNITGSANGVFEQETNRKLGQTWRAIGINASVLIRF